MKTFFKLRHTLLSLLLCLLAAAVAVAAVGVFDALESRFAWRADLSFNSVTSQSDATRAALRALTHDVHAYSVASEGNELDDLNALLDRYQAASPHFSWSRESLSRNPLLLQWASDDLGDGAVSSDCLILRCEDTGRTRVLTWEDYIGYGYNSESGVYEFTGLTYEKSLTEAILYVTSETLPRVQLLSGHGELSAAETAALEQRLRSANYETARVNLKTGDALDPAATLLILSPTLDVTDDELRALGDFAQAGGSLFVTVDFADPDELPNLYALYRLYGVTPLPGVVVADEGDRASYYGNVAELIPTMNSSDITDPLLAAGADFLILAPARAFRVSAAQSDLVTQVVLQSGDSAYIRTGEEGSVDLTRRADDPAGPFALAVLCDRGFEGGARSRAFFVGNSGLFTSEQLFGITYSGELLLQAMQRLQGSAAIDLDILPRSAVRPPLSAAGDPVPALLIALPPLVIAILAVAVLRPRKYL